MTAIELQVIPYKVDPNNPIHLEENGRKLIGIYKDYYPVIGFHLPWVGYFIIQNEKLVGSCSFNGKPKDDIVEISYWTFEGFEGNGIATQACKILTQMALNEDPEISVTAKTAPEENASTHILKKNGFQYVKVVQDHEIGDAWLWELK